METKLTRGNLFFDVKVQDRKKLLIEMNGVIDEKAFFQGILDYINEIEDKGVALEEIVLNWEKVKRINSIGIRAWIVFRQSLPSKGVTVYYEKCPYIIVEQMNLLPAFTGDSKVTSVFVPYGCTSCSVQEFKLVPINDGIYRGELPVQNCSKCQARMKFDEVAEYFEFLGVSGDDDGGIDLS